MDKNAKFSKTMFVQKLEKMSTVFREYRTLRLSEFYRISPLLLNPKNFKQNKEKLMTMHLARLSFLDLDTLDQNIPVVKKNVYE